jgi:hypothetical protein
MQRMHKGMLGGVVAAVAAVALAAPTLASADQFSYKAVTVPDPAGLIKFQSVKCNNAPNVGGGLASSTDDLWLLASAPTTKLAEVALPGNSWLGVFENIDMVNAHAMTVTAICETAGADNFVYRTAKFAGPGNKETTGAVSCNGMPLVGGGVYPVDPDAQVANLSAPTGSGKGWRGGAYNFANDRHDVRVTAICERTGGDRFVSHTRSVTLAAQTTGSVAIGCGAGRKLVGGGFIATDDPIDQRLHDSTPVSSNHAWMVSGTNFDNGASHTISAVSMCERP